MLILRHVTLFLAPCGFIFSAYGLLPLSLSASIAGAIFGYLFLFTINTLFKYLRNKDGMGDGDFDLLLFIGSFTGIIGCWTSIMIGSIVGSLYGLCSIIFLSYRHKENNDPYNTKIPFGPFLALGAIIFIFLQRYFFLIFSLA